MLTLAYGCGLPAGEVVRLRAGDIDSTQMIARIVLPSRTAVSSGRCEKNSKIIPEFPQAPCSIGVYERLKLGQEC
jgi:hypothetical protein